MKIQSIGNTYPKSRSNLVQRKPVSNYPASEPSFQGKYKYTKAFGGICATMGAIGAVVGSAIMGAFSLPIIAIYTAASAASGAIIGHQLDKKDDEDGYSTHKAEN